MRNASCLMARIKVTRGELGGPQVGHLSSGEVIGT